MASEPEPDIGQLWRQQPRSSSPPPLDDIRSRAATFDRRVRRWHLMGGALFALLIARNAWEVWVDTDILERAGDLLLLTALVYVAVWFRAQARTETAPATLGRATCLEHYRSRLARQRGLARDGWRWVLPFVPGLGLSLFGGLSGPHSTVQVAVLLVGGPATFALVLWLNARTRAQLERELAALD